ncbi:MAG: quinone-dependent dihydroorotate dehydrogenase [Tidjanibacter sp.]|nr:quinone-dependent dihydroorotate dehydrogenase [Tidjanibacter sp.]
MSFYKSFVRPILFLFPIERVHNFMLAALRVVGDTIVGEWLLGKIYTFRHPSLEREVFGVRFRNPIGAAAGLDRDARLYRQFGALGFGFVEIGSITPKPQQGNIRPRLFRVPGKRALIHHMGEPNCGIERAIEHIRRRAHGRKVVVGANIAPNEHFLQENTTKEYLRTFRNLYQYVEYFTVNVNALMPQSDHYTEEHRATIETMLEALFDFRRGQNDYRPILLKISPDWSTRQIDDMVGILIDTPLDGLVVSDSSATPGNILTPKQQSRMSGGVLSGAPLLERTIELVRYVCSKMDYSYPVIGVGGVMSTQDAQRLLDAGASLVQCFSAMVYEGPAFPGRVCRQLAAPAIAQERAQKRAK